MPARTVKFQAGEDEYVLAYDINALADIEAASMMAIGLLTSNVTVSNGRYLLWGGLRRNHEVTLTDTGDIMQTMIEKNDYSIQKIADLISEGLIAAGLLDKPDEDEEEEPKAEGDPGNVQPSPQSSGSEE